MTKSNKKQTKSITLDAGMVKYLDINVSTNLSAAIQELIGDRVLTDISVLKVETMYQYTRDNAKRKYPSSTPSQERSRIVKYITESTIYDSISFNGFVYLDVVWSNSSEKVTVKINENTNGYTNIIYDEISEESVEDIRFQAFKEKKALKDEGFEGMDVNTVSASLYTPSNIKKQIFWDWIEAAQINEGDSHNRDIAHDVLLNHCKGLNLYPSFKSENYTTTEEYLAGRIEAINFTEEDIYS